MHKLTYESAIQELQNIVDKLQNGQSNVDQLSDNADRAVELINFCKKKLRHTETDIQHLFTEEKEN